jgi:hypothetical protein
MRHMALVFISIFVMSNSSPATAQVCVEPLSGLVSWWPADGNAIDIADGNNGSLEGGISFSMAMVDQGFTFSSNSDGVRIPHNPNLNVQSPGFSVEFWVRGTKNQPDPKLSTIVEKSHGWVDATGWAFQVYTSSGFPSFAIGDGSSSGDSTGFPDAIGEVDVLDGNFHHIAGTWDGISLRLYVDGVLPTAAATNEFNLMPVNNARDVNIGFTWGGGTPSRFYRGVVDELRVFNRALSSSEIQDIFTAGSAGMCKDTPTDCVEPPSGLVSWWSADGNAIDIADGNNGILEGGISFSMAMVDQGFTFSSNGDGVRIPQNPNLNVQSPGFSVDFWMRGTNNQPDPSLSTIVEKSHGWVDATGWAFQVYTSTGFPSFAVGNATGFPEVIGEVDVLDGNFHHIAGTWDGVSLRLYVDGVLPTAAATTEFNLIPANNARDVNIGFTWGGGTPSRFYRGIVDELGVFNRALSSSEIQDIFAAGSAGKCEEPQVGTIAGHVFASCPAPNTSLLGVSVDVYAVGSGDLIDSDTTDASGLYSIPELPTGDYTVTVVTPLGYTVSAPELGVTVATGVTTTGDFSLSCLDVVGTARGGGFWKHQVGVATGGKGRAQIDATTLCGYLDLVEAHFNTNSINQVVVYDPPAEADCPQKLLVAKDLLNLKGNVGVEARAKQQLMALLLNVASNTLSLRSAASDDGATVSQAITYCDNIIDAAGDYELAKDIAEQVNKGVVVASGVIPLSTDDIAYSSFSPNEPLGETKLGRIYPNPFNPTATIAYSIAEPGMVNVQVYDVKGALVRTLVNEFQPAAEHVVSWEGNDTSGVPAASGIYFVRLRVGGEVQTRKIALLK